MCLCKIFEKTVIGEEEKCGKTGQDETVLWAIEKKEKGLISHALIPLSRVGFGEIFRFKLGMHWLIVAVAISARETIPNFKQNSGIGKRKRRTVKFIKWRVFRGHYIAQFIPNSFISIAFTLL